MIKGRVKLLKRCVYCQNTRVLLGKELAEQSEKSETVCIGHENA